VKSTEEKTHHKIGGRVPSFGGEKIECPASIAELIDGWLE